MLCTEIVSDIQNNFCTPAKRRVSDKDLPVTGPAEPGGRGAFAPARRFREIS